MRSTTKRALAIFTVLAASIFGVGVASAQDHDGRRHRGDVHQRFDRGRDVRHHRNWDHRRNDRWDHRWDHHRWRSHRRAQPTVRYRYAPRRDYYYNHVPRRDYYYNYAPRRDYYYNYGYATPRYRYGYNYGYASPLYRYDYDRDGFISPYEARRDWQLWQRFDWLDRDRDGVLSQYEIQLYYR